MSKEKDSLLVTELLRQTTSLGIVSEFLKSKGLRHSAGSWDELHAKRILPALIDGTLTVADLVSLLRLVEECGRQHVFLYKCSERTATQLMASSHVESVLATMGLKALLTAPRILDQPSKPTIVDVRWAGAAKTQQLIIKVVEQRKYQRLVSDEDDGHRITKIYERINERAVNIARLHADGFLEMRIASHTNSSEYEKDVEAFWAHIGPLVPLDEFAEVSLSAAKQNLLSRRATLTGKIRFSNSTLRNDKGTVMRAACMLDGADLMKDRVAVDCIDRFLQTAQCDSQNIFFRAIPPTYPREIHVRLDGRVNEFAVTASCSLAEYEYVFSELRTLNS